MERYEVVYHIDSDDGIDGVDVRDFAGTMCSFADLVQGALDANDAKGKLEVKVKPFERGSFVAEFVLSWGNAVVDLFSSQGSSALANALSILGFVGGASVTLPKVVRKVKGRIDDYTDNGDGTFTYGGNDGMRVPADVHNAVQSTEVAKAFKRVSTGPIVNLGGSVTVTIQSGEDFRRGVKGTGDHFTDADLGDIEMYENVAVDGVPEEREDITSTAHKVVFYPVSGPYDGAENGYTFKCGDRTYRRVQMLDPTFLARLESGDVRLMNRDVLIVDLETVQSITSAGHVREQRSITRVIEYRPFVKTQQLSIGDCSKELEDADHGASAQGSRL